jgi:hypothetical protein
MSDKNLPLVNRMVEAFIMYCDEYDLTVDQGIELAEDLIYALEVAADDRRDYA